jgi:hypothetical protein
MMILRVTLLELIGNSDLQPHMLSASLVSFWEWNWGRVHVEDFLNPVELGGASRQCDHRDFPVPDRRLARGATDKFYVAVNGNEIDLGEMDSTSTSTTINGAWNGMTWERVTDSQGSNLGFNSASDKMHYITMQVPSSIFPGNELTIIFGVTVSQPISVQEAGVDDLLILAYYNW